MKPSPESVRGTLAADIVFTLITCGIYGLFWQSRIFKISNTLNLDAARHSRWLRPLVADGALEAGLGTPPGPENPQAIQASVSQREIKALPGSFGDALRAVQALPGVGAPNDFYGQLLV